jgi:aminoglycoside phosphotransferase (APT) family kinase protein
VLSVDPLAGSYSNCSHVVVVEKLDRRRDRIVVRRYAAGGEEPRRKAVREFRALEMLRGYADVPAPEPLLLDADGALLGSPGIVTRFVDGAIVPAHPESAQWARRCTVTARVLARIHAVPVDPSIDEYLMDVDSEAVWFLAGGFPEYMRAHPRGPAVWQAVATMREHLTAVDRTLVHVDYWSGNILWDGDRISAVVDCEEAGCGDPAVDVAYCVMEFALEGLSTAAVDFVDEYERASGRRLANLGYWKLAAAARPMLDIDAWMTAPAMAERFDRFIEQSLREVC